MATMRDPYHDLWLDAFDRHAKSMIAASRICLDQGHTVSALILVYAGIDAMAWLNRRRDAGEKDVTREDFIRWANKYVRPKFQRSRRVTGQDLYGARCALLHSGTPHSRLLHQGKVRPLFYLSSRGEPLESFATPRFAKRRWIHVPAEHLVNAFEHGVGSFRADILRSTKKDLILSRCVQFLQKLRLPSLSSGTAAIRQSP
jgi:hypothetical protein